MNLNDKVSICSTIDTTNLKYKGMTMSAWSFLNDVISNGLHSIKFSQLVKFNPTSQAVETINGDPVPLLVANADKVGTSSEADLARKDYLSGMSGKANDFVSGSFGMTDLVEEVASAFVNYTGRGNSNGLTTIGAELLPNVDFTSLNNITMTSGTGVSFASNELRMATNDGNVCSMTATLQAGKYYIFKCTVTSGIGSIFVKNASAVDVDGINGYVNGTRNTVFKCAADGVYTFSMKNTNPTTTTMVSFKAPSIKEVDVVNLSVGEYVTIPETKANDERTQVTLVKTGIPVKDINYNPANTYSNEAKNNLAFLYGTFDLLQYISTVPGKDGFVKDGSLVNLEYFRNTSGKYLGNFSDTDATSFNLIGNSTKTITAGNLNITRSATSGSCECYVDNTTGIGKYMLLEINTGTLLGSWELEYGGVNLQLNTTRRWVDGSAGSYLMGENQVLRYLVKTTTNVSKLRIICTSAALTDTINIKSISVKEIDTSVWSIVTPTSNESYSPVFKWDNIHLEWIPKFLSGIATATTGNEVYYNLNRQHSSLFGSASYIAAGGTFGDKRLGLAKCIEYGDNMLRFPRGTDIPAMFANSEKFSYTLHMESYDTVCLYRDNHGKLSLIASDKASEKCMMISELSNRFQQQIKHGLGSMPNVGMVANDGSFFNPNFLFIKNKPCKSLPYAITYARDQHIEQAGFCISDGSVGTFITQDSEMGLRMEDEYVSWKLLVPTVKRSIGFIKLEVNNQHRMGIKYQGTASPFKIKTPFTPGGFLLKPLKATFAYATRKSIKDLHGSDRWLVTNYAVDAATEFTAANTFRYETDGLVVKDNLTYVANDFITPPASSWSMNEPNQWYAMVLYSYGSFGKVSVKRPTLTNKLTIDGKLHTGATVGTDTRGYVNKITEVPKVKIENIRG